MPRNNASLARHDYLTPQWFLDLVRQVAPIVLDPCGDPTNHTDARFFCCPGYTGNPDHHGAHIGNDGLTLPWGLLMEHEIAFVNPPYGRQLPLWTEKIIAEDVPSIVLVPARTEVVWWKKLYHWCDACLLWSSPEHGSRISFVNPDTGLPVRGNDHASTVFLRDTQHAGMRNRFESVFGPHGTLVKW